jgi:hypothetical protein
VAFARVVDGEAFGAEGEEEILKAGNYFPDGGDVVALVLEVAFRGTNWGSVR